MSKNPKIKTLTDAIMIVQLDSFIDKFETEMRKENNKTKKWLKIGFIPFGICASLSLILLNTIPLVIGTTYLSAVSIVKLFKDGAEEEEKIRMKYNPNPKITTISSDIPDFDFLNEPIITQKEEDFHSDYFKEKLIESARKSKLTLVDSNGNVLYSNQNTKTEYEEIPGFLNKEETMVQISTEYKTYKIAYNLPELSITNREWDLLFDTIYHKLEESSTEDKLYDYMSFLLRYVIAYSLIHKKQDISLNSFINQLHRLEYIGMEKSAIKDIIKELNNHLKPTKVIKFDVAKLSKKSK